MLVVQPSNRAARAGTAGTAGTAGSQLLHLFQQPRGHGGRLEGAGQLCQLLLGQRCRRQWVGKARGNTVRRGRGRQGEAGGGRGRQGAHGQFRHSSGGWLHGFPWHPHIATCHYLPPTATEPAPKPATQRPPSTHLGLPSFLSLRASWSGRGWPAGPAPPHHQQLLPGPHQRLAPLLPGERQQLQPLPVAQGCLAALLGACCRLPLLPVAAAY